MKYCITNIKTVFTYFKKSIPRSTKIACFNPEMNKFPLDERVRACFVDLPLFQLKVNI